MLGLGDQVSGQEGRVGAAVGDDRDLGRAGLGVHRDLAAEQPLGRGDVHVAGPGDDVRRRAVRGAVAEHRDGLGTAGRVHLGDAEQRAGAEDGRVRQPALIGLRRRGDRDLAHPGGLGRDDVHDHRRRVGDQAAGHVHPGPADRHVPLGDGGAGRHGGDSLGRHLVQVHQPGPPGGLLEGGPQVGVEPGQGVVQGLLGHPRGGQVHPVEPGRMLADRRAAAPPDVLADRPDRGQGGLHIQLGARQQAGELAGAQLAGGLTAKIHSHQHASSLRERPRAAPAPVPAAPRRGRSRGPLRLATAPPACPPAPPVASARCPPAERRGCHTHAATTTWQQQPRRWPGPAAGQLVQPEGRERRMGLSGASETGPVGTRAAPLARWCCSSVEERAAGCRTGPASCWAVGRTAWRSGTPAQHERPNRTRRAAGEPLTDQRLAGDEAGPGGERHAVRVAAGLAASAEQDLAALPRPGAGLAGQVGQHGQRRPPGRPTARPPRPAPGRARPGRPARPGAGPAARGTATASSRGRRAGRPRCGPRRRRPGARAGRPW